MSTSIDPPWSTAQGGDTSLSSISGSRCITADWDPDTELEEVTDGTDAGADAKGEKLRRKPACRIEDGMKRPRDQVDAAETEFLALAL